MLLSQRVNRTQFFRAESGLSHKAKVNVMRLDCHKIDRVVLTYLSGSPALCLRLACWIRDYIQQPVNYATGFYALSSCAFPLVRPL